LAEQVGIEGAPSDGDADLAIRSAGTGSCHPVLDLCFSDDSVVLTVSEQPPLELWLAIRQLLGQLS